jgi:hypothetical protein
MRATTKRQPGALVQLPFIHKNCMEALGEVDHADNVSVEFTREMKYLSRAMQVKVPFLPMYGVDEAKLFSRRLVLPQFDEDHMVIGWCKYGNGTTIFPKLPVYKRMYINVTASIEPSDHTNNLVHQLLEVD